MPRETASRPSMQDILTEFLPAFIPWLVCAVAVVCGTVIQKLSSTGFGMIAAPTMTIMAPEWVPGTILLLGFLIGVGSLLGARDAVVRSDLPPGLAGLSCPTQN